ncbi:MAG: glyoxylate/hydroxypyruvate reductase A [Gammaproteobacteria bacterium]|nr:glyoxylate/hydroxypyruvate reductase A [Gammaproteobacteria bacterium]
MNHLVPFVHNLPNDNESAWLSILRTAMPKMDIRPIRDISEKDRNSVEVAIVANPAPADLSALPNLKWIQSLWAGVEKLLGELPDDQIAIVRLIDPQLAETMAEAVLAWTLYLHRNMPKYAMQQTQREWKQHDVLMASERTIGILGLGHLGKKSANRLHQNGFKVVGWSRSAKKLPGVETFNGDSGLLEIAKQVDIIVVLLPSTPQTRGLLEHHFFENMKPGASLINFARADIINADALTKGLEDRRIEHAVLDVFLNEPLPKTDPLWNNPHVTVLPHISAPTNMHTASQIVAENLLTYFTSKEIPLAVSRQDGY